MDSFLAYLRGAFSENKHDVPLVGSNGKERRDWFQSVDKAASRNETETEGERSRVVMWRAHLSTSHLLFYNSPWKKRQPWGSVEHRANDERWGEWANTGEPTSVVQTPTFLFSNYSCSQYTCTSDCEHVNSLAFGAGPCISAHFVYPTVCQTWSHYSFW